MVNQLETAHVSVKTFAFVTTVTAGSVPRSPSKYPFTVATKMVLMTRLKHTVWFLQMREEATGESLKTPGFVATLTAEDARLPVKNIHFCRHKHGWKHPEVKNTSVLKISICQHKHGWSCSISHQKYPLSVSGGLSSEQFCCYRSSWCLETSWSTIERARLTWAVSQASRWQLECTLSYHADILMFNC